MALTKEKRKLSAMDIPKINQTYKNAKRLQKILTVFTRYGFSLFIDNIGLGKLVPFAKRKDAEPESPRSVAERLCRAFEELGPTFIKLGQMLSHRPDLVGTEASKAFRRLQDNVAPVPFEEIRQVIESELDSEISELFLEIDATPLAQASIAQVHRAALKDGTRVVVKVQKPNIQKIIETDISILFFLAKQGEKYIAELEYLNPVSIVEEFSHMMRSGTDFIKEASNTDAIRTNLITKQDIIIPEVYWEYTAKRVLTMEEIRGVKLSELNPKSTSGFDLTRLCEIGVDAFFHQIFTDGLFHTDAHGGNLIALQGNRLALLDFGEVGRIGTHARASIASLIACLMQGDFYGLAREYVNLGEPKDLIDLDKFSDDLERSLTPSGHMQSNEFSAGLLLNKAMKVARDYKIRFPRDLILLGRVIMTVEEEIKRLDPDFDILKHGEPYAKEIARDELDPKKMAKSLLWNLKDLGDLTRTLPIQFRIFMDRLLGNKLLLQFDFRKLTDVLRELDRIANRLAFAIIIMGLIIGSSILTFTNRGPQIFEISAFGLIGYTIAGILGLGLLVSILRSGRY